MTSAHDESRLPRLPGWTPLAENDQYWRRFADRFQFRPGIAPELWPAIRDLVPSLTFDISGGNEVGASWASRHDAINAEALRCFVTEFDDPHFVVLSWQRQGYLLDAAAHAEKPGAPWRVPVCPNGDYSVFLRPDLTAGTFGHPWEQTLCVFGDTLVGTLGRTLATWLPLKRIDGVARTRG